MCFIVGGDRAGLSLVLPTTETSLVPCGQVGRGVVSSALIDPWRSGGFNS